MHVHHFSTNPEFNLEHHFQNSFKISNISQPPPPPNLQHMKNPLWSQVNIYKLNKISINPIPINLEFMCLRNCSPHPTFYESLTFMCSCHHYTLAHNSTFFFSHLKTFPFSTLQKFLI